MIQQLAYYLMLLASSRHVARSNLHVGAVTTRQR